MNLLALLLLSTVPQPGITTDRVDVIEVNATHDDDCKLVFTQTLYSDFCRHRCTHVVQDWRLLKYPGMRPYRDYATGEWVAVWWDGETLREVRAQRAFESLTQHDVELESRSVLPLERRRKLSK